MTRFAESTTVSADKSRSEAGMISKKQAMSFVDINPC